MSDMVYASESYGDSAVADMAACEKANRILQAAYPNHPWMIGTDASTGTLHCRLMYQGQQVGANGYGFLLRLSTVDGPDGERKIRAAGGECLERFALARTGATAESAIRAQQNGLDLTGIVTKSRS